MTRLADHWRRDEAEMRRWLATLDDRTLERDVDILRRGRAAHAGQSPGDIEFLNYADDRGRTKDATPR